MHKQKYIFSLELHIADSFLCAKWTEILYTVIKLNYAQSTTILNIYIYIEALLANCTIIILPSQKHSSHTTLEKTQLIQQYHCTTEKKFLNVYICFQHCQIEQSNTYIFSIINVEFFCSVYTQMQRNTSILCPFHFRQLILAFTLTFICTSIFDQLLNVIKILLYIIQYEYGFGATIM